MAVASEARMLDHASDLAGQFVGAVRETHGARINQPIQSTAVVYFAALAAALVVDTVPVFAPPAWTILAFIIVKWEPNPWAIIAAGAIGSVIGRYILTLYMPRVSAKIFRRWENDNLSFLGKKLGGRFWHANTFVMLYAISPLSTTALFTAAGMARVNPWNILPGFGLGKFLGDAWVLFTAKATADEATNLLHGKVSWQTALTAAAALLLISGVLFVDWRELLGRKKLRLNFAIWKR
jgi:membrane protein YqaA with SNARE-associated domain